MKEMNVAEFLGGRKWAGRNFRIMGVRGGDDGSKVRNHNAAQAKKSVLSRLL